MSKIELQPGEVELGKWTLNLCPHGGGRYTGPLTVTNQRVLFLSKFDTSLSGAIAELIVYKGDYGLISIPKDQIQKVDVVGGLLKKKVAIMMINGAVHTLDYGLLSVEKIAEAIRQR